MALSRLDIRSWRHARPPARKGPSVNRGAVGTDYLSMKQRKECVARFQAGDASAGERLLAASFGQIHSAALKNSDNGVPFEDLIQEGCFSLFRDARTYTSVSTQSLSTTISQDIDRAMNRATTDNAREVGPITFHANIDYFSNLNSRGFADNMQGYLFFRGTIVPRAAVKLMIDNLLNTLRPRQAEVLRLRFGLDDGQPRTLEEVGKVLNVTRERIRAIENHALRRLRHPSRGGYFKQKLRTLSLFPNLISYIYTRPNAKPPSPFPSTSIETSIIRHLLSGLTVFERFVISKRLWGSSRKSESRTPWSREKASRCTGLGRFAIVEIENKFLSRLLYQPQLSEKIRYYFLLTAPSVAGC